MSDRLNPRFYMDMYEWRPTRLSGEVPRELGLVIGWALLRKDRLEYQLRADPPLRLIKRQEEVVAVAGNTSLSTRNMPKHRPCPLAPEKERLFTVRFLGRGLTGELGEDWEVHAVITWLGLWYRI